MASSDIHRHPPTMKEEKAIELDGRTGEGGGQLVRIACALASVVSIPIRITNVRGNREGPRGGGLKSQHVSSISWLAKATSAETTGLAVGSHTLEFRPQIKPWDLQTRKISIAAESAAASALLIFQAVFPFLLYAANEHGTPIRLDISGGTNVSWSLSYEYLDQVLLPALERNFTGIRVERSLKARGWSLGKLMRGKIEFVIHPLKPGESLHARYPEGELLPPGDPEVVGIDVSIVAPWAMQESLKESLVQNLGDLFHEADVEFKVVEDSGEDTRVYVLLVAKSEAGLRWGRDILTSVPKKSRGKGVKAAASFSQDVSLKVCKELFDEVSTRGVVDEFLQDQLVIFQALAEGRSSFPRSVSKEGEQDKEDGLEAAMDGLDLGVGGRLRKDKTHEPFGEGSTHTTTARWVVSELLPRVQWFNKGRICEGIGMYPEEKSPVQELSQN